MLLDLRDSHPFPEELQPLFQRLAGGVAQELEAIFNTISEANNNSFSWFLSPLASRNPLASRIYHHCTCIALIEAMLTRENPIDRIITDSPAMEKILRKRFETEEAAPEISCIPLQQKTGLLGRCLLLFRRIAEPWRYARETHKHLGAPKGKESAPTGALTLIDTFTSPGFVEIDRLYGDIAELAPGSERQQIHFVPTLSAVGRGEIKTLCKELKESGRRFLFKERYLIFTDYLQSWLKTVQCIFLPVPEVSFRSLPIRELLLEDHKDASHFRAIFSGFLNERFAYRLKKNGVSVRVAVDWFENQPMDRGWNYGFNQHFPECRTIGYQGYPPLSRLPGHFPSPAETRAGIMPQTLAVVGEKHRERLMRENPAQKVMVVPALRYNHIFLARKPSSPHSRFAMLAALPYSWDSALHILHTLSRTLGSLQFEYDVLVKPHPSHRQETVLSALQDMLPQAILQTGDIMDAYEKADVVVTNSSTVIYEAMAHGLPVASLEEPCHLSINPLPDDVPPDFARSCFTPSELASFIDSIRSTPARSERFASIANDIRHGYFTPITPEGIKDLLGIPRT